MRRQGHGAFEHDLEVVNLVGHMRINVAERAGFLPCLVTRFDHFCLAVAAMLAVTSFTASSHFEQRLRIAVGNQQQRAGRPGRCAPSLFPFLERAGRDAEQSSEMRLR